MPKTITKTRPRTAAKQARRKTLVMPDPGGVFSITDAIMRYRRPMSVDELAPLLDVSRDVLYRMVRDGKIPKLIMPGHTVTRFDPATVCHWLRKHNPILNQVAKAS